MNSKYYNSNKMQIIVKSKIILIWVWKALYTNISIIKGLTIKTFSNHQTRNHIEIQIVNIMRKKIT